MPTQSQVRRYSLIGALLLPILLIGAVWLSHQVPAVLSPPPKYDFIYSVPDKAYGAKRSIEEDGQLVLTDKRRNNSELKSSDKNPQLYRYDVSSNTAQLLSYEIKEVLPSGKYQHKARIVASQVTGLIPGKVAPDGYQYERRYNRQNWLGLFRSHHYVHHAIVKDKNVMVFLRDKGDVAFIGWMNPKELSHE